MSPSSDYYTATMARLYAEQGYLRKAAEIYRHLLAQHPADSDLSAALETVERQMALASTPTRKELELLMREWIDLLKQKKLRERDR